MAGQALSLKGCFLARLRTHTCGHKRSLVIARTKRTVDRRGRANAEVQILPVGMLRGARALMPLARAKYSITPPGAAGSWPRRARISRARSLSVIDAMIFVVGA
jgi:hypothetical protein